jgi:hypothetical protein
LEYIFPKHGRNGRGCDGSYIEVPDPTIRYASYIVIDEETIYSEEDSGSIRFLLKFQDSLNVKKGHLPSPKS